MKKIITLIALGLHITFSSYAQESKFFYEMPYKMRNSGSFNSNMGILSLGYGFLTTINDYYAVNPNWKQLGTFYARYEHSISSEVSLGINAAFMNFRYEDPYVNKYPNYTKQVLPSYNRLNVGMTLFYHFNKFIPIKNLDAYAGVGFDVSSRWIASTNINKFFPVIRAGARYYLGEAVAIYGEVGYDNMSIVNLGLSFAFGRKANLAITKAAAEQHIKEQEDNEEDEEIERPAKNKKVKKTRN